MDIDKLKELKAEAGPFLGSDIIVEKENSKNEPEYILCTFESIYDNGVEKFESDDESSDRTMSYSPKAILRVKESNETIDRFPLKYVIKAMKKGRNINWNFFKEYKNQQS